MKFYFARGHANLSWSILDLKEYCLQIVTINVLKKYFLNFVSEMINWLIRINFRKILFTCFSKIGNKNVETNYHRIHIVFFI